MPNRLIKGGALSVAVAMCALAISGSNLKAQSALPTGWSTRDIGSPAWRALRVSPAAHGRSRAVAPTSGAAQDQFGSPISRCPETSTLRSASRALKIVDPCDQGRADDSRVSHRGRAACRHVDDRVDRACDVPASSTDSAGRHRRSDYDIRHSPSGCGSFARGTRLHRLSISRRHDWTRSVQCTMTLPAIGLRRAWPSRAAIRGTSYGDSSRTSRCGTPPAPGGGSAGAPRPWTNRDIGSPSTAGSATASAGTFTVAGAGADIYGNSDQFQFVYQPLQGDVEVIARVAALPDTNSLAKAGVMIRESLNANSRNAFMRVSAGTKRWAFQSRLETGDRTYNQSGPTGAVPGWVRLVREGNLFSAYRSTNGTSWSLLVPTRSICRQPFTSAWP